MSVSLQEGLYGLYKMRMDSDADYPGPRPERVDDAAFDAYRLWQLQTTVRRVRENRPFYCRHFERAGVTEADILSLAFAVAAPAYFFLPLLCEFASLLGYHAYLKMRYLLLMHWGAAALAFVLIVTLVFTAAQLHPVRRQKYS